MEKITVLYVSIDPSMGGSTASLFDLIKGVKDSVYPIVLFPQKGSGYDFFIGHGIECFVCPFVVLYKFKKNRIGEVLSHPWRWHPIKKVRMDLKCAWYMKNKLEGRRVDIVHTNTSPNDVGVYLSRLLHAKHVWHVRECLDLHCSAEMYGGMSRLISKINHADARIAVSNFVASHWKMKQEGTYVVHDAVRPLSEVTYNKSKERYVLFVSYYITEQKGSRMAVEAFGKSNLWKEGVDLMFVGNCLEDYKSLLLVTANTYGCKQNLRFIPCQDDVKPFFVKAIAYIMASKAEGFSRVVSESMFFGCPVLAYVESGGALDQVKNGETGYVFQDANQCAELLNKVYRESQECVILKAQEFAKKELSVESYGPKIMKVYNAVLN